MINDLTPVASSVIISPLLVFKHEYVPPTDDDGPIISTKKIGSCNLIGACKSAPIQAFFNVGMIWPPPLWIASACNATSWISNLTPLISSSTSGDSCVAPWNAAIDESLISLSYWTPFVTSTKRLAPICNGPKHQIFLVSSGS